MKFKSVLDRYPDTQINIDVKVQDQGLVEKVKLFLIFNFLCRHIYIYIKLSLLLLLLLCNTLNVTILPLSHQTEGALGAPENLVYYKGGGLV